MVFHTAVSTEGLDDLVCLHIYFDCTNLQDVVIGAKASCLSICYNEDCVAGNDRQHALGRFDGELILGRSNFCRHKFVLASSLWDFRFRLYWGTVIFYAVAPFFILEAAGRRWLAGHWKVCLGIRP